MKNRVTVFNTPILRPILRLIFKVTLKLLGWKIIGQIPKHEKMLFIMAPHTSNWDLPYCIMMAFIIKIQPQWLGKDSMFKFPFGGVMRWLGGIPVDRSKSNNQVEAISQMIVESDKILLALAPEGTRKKVSTWKSGFYYMAKEAKVPIICAYADYEKKEIGMGPLIEPKNLQKDLAQIKEFYHDKKGKYPGLFDNEGIKFKAKTRS